MATTPTFDTHASSFRCPAGDGPLEEVVLDRRTLKSNDGAPVPAPESEMGDLAFSSLVIDGRDRDPKPSGDLASVQ
jgi:hypothetical protein